MSLGIKHTYTHTLSDRVKDPFLPQGVIRSVNSPVLPQSITELYDPPASRQTQACWSHTHKQKRTQRTPPARIHLGSSLSTCLSVCDPGATLFLFLLYKRKRILFLFASLSFTLIKHVVAGKTRQRTQNTLFSSSLSPSLSL